MSDIGPLTFTATGARRFLVFQSMPQFAGWAAIVVLMCGAGSAIAALLGASPPDLDALACGMAGTLPSLWLARRASFRVRGPGCAQAFASIDAGLCARHYRLVGRHDGEHLYRPKLPRWLRWDEQDVCLSMRHDGLVVTGPYGALHAFRRRLAAHLSG